MPFRSLFQIKSSDLTDAGVTLHYRMFPFPRVSNERLASFFKSSSAVILTLWNKVSTMFTRLPFPKDSIKFDILLPLTLILLQLPSITWVVSRNRIIPVIIFMFLIFRCFTYEYHYQMRFVFIDVLSYLLGFSRIIDGWHFWQMSTNKVLKLLKLRNVNFEIN